MDLGSATVSAVGSVIVAALQIWGHRRAEKAKANTDEKLEVITTDVNGNLHQTNERLKIALSRIEDLERLLRAERVSPRHRRESSVPKKQGG